MKKLLLSLLLITTISFNAFSQDMSLCASPIIDGNNVELQIKTTGFSNIGGFQFAVAWELSKLNYVDVGNENADLSGLAYNQIDDHQSIEIGVLRSLWAHSGGLSATLMKSPPFIRSFSLLMILLILEPLESYHMTNFLSRSSEWKVLMYTP